MGQILSESVQRRRPYKTGSIERRGPGVYRLRVVVRDPATTRLIRRSKTVHLPDRGNKKQLEEEMATFRTEVSEVALVGSKATVASLMDEWMETIVNRPDDFAQNTVKAYRSRVLNQIRPELGDVRLCDLTVHQVDSFYTRISTTLSARSVLLVHSVLRQALQQAVIWGWISSNPAAQAKRPKVHNTDKPALTPDEVAAIYEAAFDEPAIRAAIGLAATTGMRRGEVCGLKWSDIKGGMVTIRRAWVSDEHGQHLNTSANKKLKPRTIPLGQFGSNVLATYRGHQVEIFGQPLGEWMISYGDGTEPLQVRALTNYFSRIVKRVGIEATFHDLRHFHQSVQISGGVDIVTAARRAGHSPEIMLSHYAHGTAEQDAKAAEIVSEILIEALGRPTAT